MDLTLFIPQLIWPEPDDRATLDAVQCPALNQLLPRGSLHRDTTPHPETGLLALWQAPPKVSLATLRLCGEEMPPPTLPKGRRWVCADPVHLRFHQERIILGDAGTFELSPQEAQALARSLNETFSDIGQFVAATSLRWYLDLNSDLAVNTPPLSQVAGRQLATELLAAPEHHWLRRLLNEIQMFLHQHPVNQAREAAGKPVINSLWLWGAGDPLPALQSPYDVVCANQPLTRGLAATSQLSATPTPEQLAHVPQARQALVEIDTLVTPTLYEDGEAWGAALMQLEARWFAPLADQLARGKLRQARIVTTGLFGTATWTLKPAQRWCFWKHPQSLAQITQSLASSQP